VTSRKLILITRDSSPIILHSSPATIARNPSLLPRDRARKSRWRIKRSKLMGYFLDRFGVATELQGENEEAAERVLYERRQPAPGRESLLNDVSRHLQPAGIDHSERGTRRP